MQEAVGFFEKEVIDGSSVLLFGANYNAVDIEVLFDLVSYVFTYSPPFRAILQLRQGVGNFWARAFLINSECYSEDDGCYYVDSVVVGDGQALFEKGAMRRGKMYATSLGGAQSKRYWSCVWYENVTEGMPCGETTFSLAKVHRMNGSSTRLKSLIIPEHISQGTRRGRPSRDQFVADFLRRWCMKQPGIGVVLRRIGGGDSLIPNWMLPMLSSVRYENNISPKLPKLGWSSP